MEFIKDVLKSFLVGCIALTIIILYIALCNWNIAFFAVPCVIGAILFLGCILRR